MSQRLIHLIPPYYKKSKVANGVLGAVETETDRLIEFALDVIRQGNPKLATWGLVEWENLMKLSPLPDSTPIEKRRARVLARMRTPPLITPLEMEKLAGEFTKSKSEVEVVEYGREKRFEVLVDADDLVDYEALHETVYEMRPKHLSFSVTARTRADAIIITASTRHFEVDYLLCGTFYPEDDLEGRIFKEAVAVTEAARTHTVEHLLTNTFYPTPEEV